MVWSPSEAEVVAVLALRRQGITLAKIAAALSFPATSAGILRVSRICAKHGVTAPKAERPPRPVRPRGRPRVQERAPRTRREPEPRRQESFDDYDRDLDLDRTLGRFSGIRSVDGFD